MKKEIKGCISYYDRNPTVIMEYPVTIIFRFEILINQRCA